MEHLLPAGMTLEEVYPKKYELHGHVVVARLNPGIPLPLFAALSSCFAASFAPIEVDVVLVDEVGISGELRRPTLTCTWPEASAEAKPPSPALLAIAKTLRQRWGQAEAAGASGKPVSTAGLSGTALKRQLKAVRSQNTDQSSAAEAGDGQPTPSSCFSSCVHSAEELESLIQQVVLSSPTFTTHIENRVTYGLDVNRVMFSSGNTTERGHFSTVNATGEVVVDMFCGIGYFTLPLAMRGSPQVIHAIDKNPDSVAFIKVNAVMNRVSHIVRPQCGDNREVGDELVGSADRVLMGYLPDCVPHLARAVQFLKRSSDGSERPRGMVHYHYLAPSDTAEAVLWEHLNRGLGGEQGNTWRASLKALRCVKSYAPKVFHYVADVAFD